MAIARTDLAKLYEGPARLAAYDDGTGTWTIGYGETGPSITQGTVWTVAQAEDALAAEFARRSAYIESILSRPMSPAQFDAVVDLAYNAGLGAGRAVVTKFNAGDELGALMEFAEWDEAKTPSGPLTPWQGLVRRRTREVIRWTTGL